MNHPNTLSEQLLLAVKMKKSYAEILETLANIPQQDLEKQLLSNKHKIAFWINIYNSFFQILRKDKHLKQPKIYTAKQMTVAGQQLSLDDIEHGILRRFRYKYSLGYLPNIFVSALIKKWAVTAVDFRIHFALNCGAKSCPPIAFYNVDQLEKQLDLASTSFNQVESHLNHENKVMHVSRLFLWFLKDFGGTTGTRKIISKSFDQDLTAYKISYKPYSWEEHLDNYDEKRFSS